MENLQDKTYCPTLDEIGTYIGNPVFFTFCSEVKSSCLCKETIMYSACSWEKGWNVKFKKSGRSLCTVYPRQSYFTVLLVVGQKEKEAVEAILPDCTARLQEIYAQTQEGNGQKWLMIDLEDRDDLYRDVFRLLAIRKKR